MKKSMVTKFILGIVCILLVGSMAMAKEEVSFSLDDLNYSLVRQYNVGEFYGRTSVDVVHDTQTSTGYLQFDGGHLNGDELFHFSISVYEADKWGSGDSIWHENYETMQVNIPFSLIREWGLEPGEYLISLAAKGWGEGASLDMYEMSVTEKKPDDGNGSGNLNPGGDVTPPIGDKDGTEEEITKPDMQPEQKPDPVPEQKVTKPGKVSIQTVKRTSAKKAKLTWKKIKGSDIQYEVQCATSKKFKKKDTVTKNLKKNSITLSKLNKNKKYYVKVRAYKVINGKKIYGSYSSIKTIKKWKK